jgi:hypothetical protein
MAAGLPTLSNLFDGRRPRPITPPPSGGEIKKLREKLLKRSKSGNGLLTEAACEFLAASVTSPGAIRQQLDRPTIRPTATGHLEVIYATVPIDCTAPDPTNGRVNGATAWPAADVEEGQTLKLWAPADMTVHPDSSSEILLTSDSVTSIKTVFENSAEHTKKLNPAMKAKIEQDGLLDPLLCQIGHISTLDGQRGIALITRDGSTRCSFAKEAHRQSAHDAFFGAIRDVDVRRQRWLEMRRRTEQAMDLITGAELIELRTFLVDVQIVIAFASDDPHVTALDAVDDVVRRTHVETTHPWLPVARSNSEADQMLAVLRARGVIGEEEFLLFGGKLARSQRASRKLPVDADRVLAELMLRLGATETKRAALDELHANMRTVDGRGQIRNNYKATLAGALGLRQFHVEPRALETAHLTLGEALDINALWEQKWENTNRSPEQLRDAAREELDGDEGDPGPACRELAVKAAGHMAAQGWLKRESRDPRGGFRDQRPSNSVLEALYRTEHGIQVLAEALAAGRRGEPARAVREDGEVIELVAGDNQLLNNQWIRRTFDDAPVRDVTARPTMAGAAALTQREQVAARIRAMETLATDLERQLEEATKITATDGGSFLERTGWSPGETEPLAVKLGQVVEKLRRYGVIGDINPGLPPVEQLSLSTSDAEEA